MIFLNVVNVLCSVATLCIVICMYRDTKRK